VGSAPEITLPNGNIMVTNPTCFGLSNGAITITPQGGAGGFTYQWNNGATTKDLSNLAAGTYTPVVTDANGCVKVLTSIDVTNPQQLVAVMVNKSDVRCFGTATGGANINFTGGTGNKTFCWFAPPNMTPCVSNMEDPNNLPAGTYNLIVTDQNGCTSTHVQNVVINGPASALTVSGTTTPSPCFDTPNGAIDLTVSGGWSNNYTYAWTGGLPAVQDHPTLVQPGTYTVTVTDANQCTATHSVTVSGSTAIVSATQIQHVTCFGQNNGGINLNLSGGTPTYSVVWSNTTLTGQSIGNLSPGNYQPTITDSQGCTKVLDPITVTGPGELMVNTNITQANPNDGAIVLNILNGGTPAFSFAWSGPNGFSATTQSISGLSEGDYTVVITDANNCVRSFSFNVPSGNVVGGTTVASITDACAEDGCIFLNIPAVASAQTPFTLHWGFGSMQTSSLSPQICDLKAGVYNITVTAANGNSTVLTGVQVAQRDPASVNVNSSDPFSSLLNNGKISLSPASGVQCQLQYQWAAPLNSTSAEVTGLGQGTYTVTITNPCSGCTAVRSFSLSYGAPGCGTINAVNPNCAASANGAIEVTVQGGFLPYMYNWVGPNNFASTQQNINLLAPGVYNFTVTDQNGNACTLSQTLTAQSNLAITNVNELSNYGGFQVSGINECDGVAVLAFTPGVGAVTIQWSNGVTGVSNNSLCAGAYSVTVMDAVGCSSVWNDVLTAPAAISAAAQSDGVKCHSDCNGIARVSPSGGVGPYSVRWSTGQNDPLVFGGAFSQAVGLCGGDYTVTITDDNGVDQVVVVNVPRPAPIEATFSPTAPRNFNACDGEMTINITGAVAPVTYTWSGSFGHSGNSAKAEGLCSGEFIQFQVVDANGCFAYLADTVPYPEDGCFRVSPIITPGTQDGKNDYVYVTCIETALKSRMEIYNRWGQLVFETDGYTNNDSDREHNWNGLTRSGSPLAEGAYYYVLSITYVTDLGVTREEIRKGSINLLR
jgi:gliding motility-associated-like protein